MASLPCTTVYGYSNKIKNCATLSISLDELHEYRSASSATPRQRSLLSWQRLTRTDTDWTMTREHLPAALTARSLLRLVQSAPDSTGCSPGKVKQPPFTLYHHLHFKGQCPGESRLAPFGFCSSNVPEHDPQDYVALVFYRLDDLPVPKWQCQNT